MRLLADAALPAIFARRAAARRLCCCVCQSTGWAVDEQRVLAEGCVMVRPTCGDEEHAVCTACVQRLCRGSDTHLGCPFPFSRSPCRGRVPERHWRKLQSPTAHGCYALECSACQHVQLVADVGTDEPRAWACGQCRRVACVRCDAVGACGCEMLPQSALPRGFSRCFTRQAACGEQPRPLRRHRVTREDVSRRLVDLAEHAPWLHARCPACDARLFKSSACNDLHHCGSTHVCNHCLQQSFPWEPRGLPAAHWAACPRWDHDTAGVLCREGHCSSDGSECRVPEHAASVLRLHATRWRAALEALRADVGAAKFTAAATSVAQGRKK
jgi:hypothetical protein